MLSNAKIQPKSTVELGYMCPRGLWSTISDTHQVVEIYKETSTKMYTPVLIGFNKQYGPYNIYYMKLVLYFKHLNKTHAKRRFNMADY